MILKRAIVFTVLLTFTLAIAGPVRAQGGTIYYVSVTDGADTNYTKFIIHYSTFLLL